MSLFLKRVLGFIAIPLAVIIFIVIFNYNSFPAPKISKNYSLNEKLFFFNDFDANYITIGSSLALNNIHSEELMKVIKHDNYLNLASWGMKMSDNYCMLKVYCQYNNPSVIFLAGNIIDFTNSGVKLRADQITGRISNPNFFLKSFYYLTNSDIRYYYKYLRLNKKSKFNSNFLESIEFDSQGGVLYSNVNFSVDSVSYNTNGNNFDDLNQENYQYLDSISNFVASHHCKLVFIQTPTRASLLDPTYREKKSHHIQKVKSILNKYQHDFIDGSAVDWDDSLFVDFGHFNEKGARLFTRYTISEFINSENQ